MQRYSSISSSRFVFPTGEWSTQRPHQCWVREGRSVCSWPRECSWGRTHDTSNLLVFVFWDRLWTRYAPHENSTLSWRQWHSCCLNWTFWTQFRWSGLFQERFQSRLNSTQRSSQYTSPCFPSGVGSWRKRVSTESSVSFWSRFRTAIKKGLQLLSGSAGSWRLLKRKSSSPHRAHEKYVLRWVWSIFYLLFQTLCPWLANSCQWRNSQSHISIFQENYFWGVSVGWFCRWWAGWRGWGRCWKTIFYCDFGSKSIKIPNLVS